jgi:hypothetical protein
MSGGNIRARQRLAEQKSAAGGLQERSKSSKALTLQSTIRVSIRGSHLLPLNREWTPMDANSQERSRWSVESEFCHSKAVHNFPSVDIAALSRESPRPAK